MAFQFVVMFIESFMHDVTIRKGCWSPRTTWRSNCSAQKALEEHRTCNPPIAVYSILLPLRQPDSSVGTATRYGLGGPGTETRWAR